MGRGEDPYTQHLWDNKIDKDGLAIRCQDRFTRLREELLMHLVSKPQGRIRVPGPFRHEYPETKESNRLKTTGPTNVPRLRASQSSSGIRKEVGQSQQSIGSSTSSPIRDPKRPCQNNILQHIAHVPENTCITQNRTRSVRDP